MKVEGGMMKRKLLAFRHSSFRLPSPRSSLHRADGENDDDALVGDARRADNDLFTLAQQDGIPEADLLVDDLVVAKRERNLHVHVEIPYLHARLTTGLIERDRVEVVAVKDRILARGRVVRHLKIRDAFVVVVAAPLLAADDLRTHQREILVAER